MTELKNPDVKLPPPLISAAVIVLALLLHWLFGIKLPVTPFFYRLGILLLLFACGLLAWSAWGFFRKGTTILPYQASTAIIRGGPYRYSRNPIYLSFLIIQGALGLMLGNIWLLLLLPLTIRLLRTQVIEKEEAFLHQAFGVEYQSYLQQVRRWL